MDEKEYKKLKKRIEISFKRNGGRAEGSEDCAQAVLLRWLERGNTGQTVDQAVIDYLRKQSGRKGSGSYDSRQKFNNAASIDAIDQLEGPFGFIMEERGDIGGYLRHIEEIDHAVFVLKEKWGMLETEIADIFGVSVSRICQRYKRVQSSLSKRAAQASTCKSQREREFQEVLPEETRRNLWRLEPFEDQGMEIGEPW